MQDELHRREANDEIPQYLAKLKTNRDNFGSRGGSGYKITILVNVSWKSSIGFLSVYKQHNGNMLFETHNYWINSNVSSKWLWSVSWILIYSFRKKTMKRTVTIFCSFSSSFLHHIRLLLLHLYRFLLALLLIVFYSSTTTISFFLQFVFYSFTSTTSSSPFFY